MKNFNWRDGLNEFFARTGLAFTLGWQKIKKSNWRVKIHLGYGTICFFMFVLCSRIRAYSLATYFLIFLVHAIFWIWIEVKVLRR